MASPARAIDAVVTPGLGFRTRVVGRPETAPGSPRVAEWVLDDPLTLNKLSAPALDSLAASLDDWSEDHAIAVVILRGAGERSFCAGEDLHWAALGTTSVRGSSALDHQALRDLFRCGHAVIRKLHHFPKPVICLAHGFAAGIGAALLLAASHRVITEQLELACPEPAHGLFPGLGRSWFLAHAPGEPVFSSPVLELR